MSKAISIFLACLLFQCCLMERRIKDGKPTKTTHGYAVYLSKAPRSSVKYDYWICGGAIINPWFVITSAACVEDVKHMYVISGYNKYVRPDDINKDQCTSKMKKRIVITCVPRKYNLDYARIERWSHIDIAAAKVDVPFNDVDPDYIKLCSYPVTFLDVNYDPRYQETGIDAIILGWGHTKKWRETSDQSDYNQDLRYASTTIFDKEKCKEHYSVDMADIINRYMICTNSMGNLDEKGEPIKRPDLVADGCVYEKVLIDGVEYLKCRTDEVYEESRRSMNGTAIQTMNGTEIQNFNATEIENLNVSEIVTNHTLTRRQGICQNDHGGPLVTWVGTREVLLGVASVFQVSDKLECEGPYLFTSTQCNGVFIDCVTNIYGPSRVSSRRKCNLPPKELGFKIVERKISWINHPDGPAANERIDQIQIRPQIPMDAFG